MSENLLKKDKRSFPDPSPPRPDFVGLGVFVNLKTFARYCDVFSYSKRIVTFVPNFALTVSWGESPWQLGSSLRAPVSWRTKAWASCLLPGFLTRFDNN